jgi:hypothetical protein
VRVFVPVIVPVIVCVVVMRFVRVGCSHVRGLTQATPAGTSASSQDTADRGPARRQAAGGRAR